MNAYETLTLSRDLECIRSNIKRFSVQAYYYSMKSFHFKGLNAMLPLSEISDDWKDAYNALLRTGYNSFYAANILINVNHKARKEAEKDYAESQRMKRAFENRDEVLSF